MAQPISLQELIALNNTQKAKKLLLNYGYKPARNYNDLVTKLFILTKEHREDALKDLADLHPHKDLILNYFCAGNEEKSNVEGKDNNSDCNCPSCALSRMKMFGFSNLEGDVQPKDEKMTIQGMLPTILIAGFVSLIMIGALKQYK